MTTTNSDRSVPARFRRAVTATGLKPALRSLRTAARSASRRVRHVLVAPVTAGFRTRVNRHRHRSMKAEPRPTIWYVPHPDDESIFMAGSIRANRTSRNLVVLLSRGGASKARVHVNARLDTPLDEAAFMAAREREFRAAITDLGIAREDVVVLDLPDGAFDFAAVREVIRDMERRLPGATHRTLTDLDPHPDHSTVGTAVRAAHRAGEIRDCVFHVPYPLIEDDEIGVRIRFTADMINAKRQALGRYTRWDPDSGWYAIGRASVPRLIQQQLDNPEERIHRPPTRV